MEDKLVTYKHLTVGQEIRGTEGEERGKGRDRHPGEECDERILEE